MYVFLRFSGLLFALLFLQAWGLCEHGNSVVVLNKHVEKEFSKGYRLDIAYPEVQHLYMESTHSLNLSIQRIAWEAVARFRRRVEDRPPGVGLHSLTLRYQVCHKGATFLSLRFERHQELAGLPPRPARHTTFNYDFLQHRTLKSLQDLFDAQTPYGTGLSEYLLKHYNLALSPAYIDSEARFCVRDGGVALSFPQNRQCENQEFLIPWSAIAPWLPRHSALGAMAQGR